MPTTALRGPALFSAYQNRTLVEFSPQTVSALHAEVFSGVNAKFRENKVTPPFPVAVEVFDLDGFRRYFSDIPAYRNSGLSVEHEAAMTRMDVEPTTVYCTDTLRKISPQDPAARLVLNQVVFSGYAHQIWRAINQHDQSADSINEFSLLTLGFATYLSNHPFNDDAALKTEFVYLAGIERFAKWETAFHWTLTNPHFIGALFLQKIEAAFGFNAMLEVLQNVPGVSTRGGRVALNHPLKKMWQKYVEANQSLGCPALDYNFLTSGQLVLSGGE